jgi:DNA polymerase-3 subunit gamma/tau
MSYRVLARKYRPQNLEQLVGQENLAQSLKNAFENDLKQPQVTPCDICVSCQGILSDRHMDVVEIDAASHTGVDDMRELTESSRYKAVQGRYKIFIIDEVHMLSKSAFNALLKTLEEPPSHVKFIFATTEIKKIPDTILSRCMRFDLSTMQPAKIIKHLQDILEKESVLAEVDALAMIARAADGSMRDALSITDQAIMLSGSATISAEIVQAMLGLSNRDALFAIFESIFQGNVEQAIQSLHTIYENGGDPLLIAQDLIHILYWVICLKNVPSLSKDMAWPEADRQKGQQLAALLPTSILLQNWDLMQKSYDDVRSSHQPFQALDVALMRLAFVKDVLTNPSAVSGGQNVQSSSSIASSVSRASMPQTFEAMADLLLYAKEGLLHGHILHDVHLISYAPGHLVCGLGVRAPKNFAKLLKDVCERITKQPWEIELRQDNSTPTIVQAKAIERENLRQQALDHPLIKEILHIFPDAKVTIN